MELPLGQEKVWNQDHLYIPDFIIIKGKRKVIVEVKCDHLRNFDKKDKVKYLSTYNKNQLNAKLQALEIYCKKNDFECELITMDNKYFEYLYNRAKRLRRENKRKENCKV